MYSKNTEDGFYRIKNAGKPARNKTDTYKLKMSGKIAILISNAIMVRVCISPGPGKSDPVHFFRPVPGRLVYDNDLSGTSDPDYLQKTSIFSFVNPKPGL